jgi:hypothetical protein
MNKTRLFTVIGWVLTLPACLLICLGVSGRNVPPVVSHPVLVVGGLIAALALNTLSILRIGLETGTTGAAEAVTVRLKVAPATWVIILFSTLLLACITAYVFVENFQLRVIN